MYCILKKWQSPLQGWKMIFCELSDGRDFFRTIALLGHIIPEKLASIFPSPRFISVSDGLQLGRTQVRPDSPRAASEQGSRGGCCGGG